MIKKSLSTLHTGSFTLSLPYAGPLQQIQPPEPLRPSTLRSKGCRQQRSKHTSNDIGNADPSHHDWPTLQPGATLPTPYEIFKCDRRTPYSKQRYYQLVKIYHPDKDGHHSHDESLSAEAKATGHRPKGVPRATRLERYRLIVEANEILSDPVKKDAYDRHGFGWGSLRNKTMWGRQATDGSWSSFYGRDSPAHCATWEDWEKWYERNSSDGRRQQQQPIYVSNGNFVLLIVTFAIVAGVLEIRRAGHLSRSLLQQLEAVHDDTSKQLNSVKAASRGFGSNDERIQNFLDSRRTMAEASEERRRDMTTKSIGPLAVNGDHGLSHSMQPQRG